MMLTTTFFFFFFFNATATTEIYTLSLHDALPISGSQNGSPSMSKMTSPRDGRGRRWKPRSCSTGDRKSTRLNSSHVAISYAVFCLKKKKKKKTLNTIKKKKNDQTSTNKTRHNKPN